jgi:hypothetical protein
MKWEPDRCSNFVLRKGHQFRGGRGLRRDVACKQATDVRTIRAWLSWSVVATTADRRVAGDELLIDKMCCVQTSNERLQRQAARECMGDN